MPAHKKKADSGIIGYANMDAETGTAVALLNREGLRHVLHKGDVKLRFTDPVPIKLMVIGYIGPNADSDSTIKSIKETWMKIRLDTKGAKP